MASSKATKRKSRAISQLFEMALGACAIGLCLLLLPFFMPKSSAFAAVLPNLQPIIWTVAWVVLATGLALLALHHFTNSKFLASPTSASGPMPAKQKMPASLPASPPLRSTPTTWSADGFADIEWRRFEAMCQALFAQAGFQTKSQSHGADGGVDVWLYSQHAVGPVAVVQCKHWYDRPVGVKELREFFGVMSSHKLARGSYATTSTFTSEAEQFASANGINALDGKRLLELIASRTPEQQTALLAVAHEGEYWRPTCASCGIKLVEREPAKGGPGFWGYANYPGCKMRMLTRKTADIR